MYPLPSLNPDGLSSNGPTISSVVMLYPYDHNTGYGSAEHLGFGSPGLGENDGGRNYNERPLTARFFGSHLIGKWFLGACSRKLSIHSMVETIGFPLIY
ncbi:hypothetical protein D5086_026022 [Populus alba]|uniref:Uncharacterized protein n=1 Tax=Populus alba TaxID=43335 RepID=A0ACC4B2I8_POPAL